MLIENNLKIENDGVSARELHKWLESTEKFNRWFSKRIEKYAFEPSEYERVKTFTPYNEAYPDKLVEVQDYKITLEMAKELAMIQQNEKGREARKYFIKCEKELEEIKLNNIKQVTMIFTHKDKLLTTKNVLYPILDGLGVLKNKRIKVHNLIKHVLIGKYENVKMSDEFDLDVFVKEYTESATKYKEIYQGWFKDSNQVSFWDVV